VLPGCGEAGRVLQGGRASGWAGWLTCRSSVATGVCWLRWHCLAGSFPLPAACRDAGTPATPLAHARRKAAVFSPHPLPLALPLVLPLRMVLGAVLPPPLSRRSGRLTWTPSTAAPTTTRRVGRLLAGAAHVLQDVQALPFCLPAHRAHACVLMCLPSYCSPFVLAAVHDC